MKNSVLKKIILLITPLLAISVFLELNFNLFYSGSKQNSTNFNQYYDYDLESAKYNGVIDNYDRNILYWIQISDIHLNMDQPDLLAKFDEFCNKTISIVDPAFIISTGDTLDADPGLEIKAQVFYQDEAEYIFFNETLEKYGFNESFWLPVIGNHERYNTEDLSLYNYYIRNQTQYAFYFNTSFGNYRFIIADTVQDPGLINFFNLFGESKEVKLNELESIINDENSPDFNQTVFVGHHPVNTIFSEKSRSGRNFEDLIVESDAVAYIYGHLHWDNYYANHDDFLEMHSQSFKKYYSYRIFAFDNDIFSFTEEKLGKWPAILVTNPIQHQYYTQNLPLERMVTDNEIRTLVFDPNPITSIYAEVDGQIIGNLTNQGDNLWVLPWNPGEYLQGQHHLKIFVSSDSGQESSDVLFDLSNFDYNGVISIGEIFLKLPLIPIFFYLSIFLSLVSFSVLIGPQIWSMYAKKRNALLSIEEFDKRKQNFRRKRLRIFVQSQYLPKYSVALILILLLYNIFGPSLIAPVLNDKIGVLILTNVYVNGGYVKSINGLIIISLFMLSSYYMESFVIHSIHRQKTKKRTDKLRLLSPLIVVFLYVGLVGYFMGIHVFYQPWLYINTLIPLILYFKVEDKKIRLPDAIRRILQSRKLKKNKSQN